MKKNLLIAFALALLVPWATRAQECTPISSFPVTYGFEESEGFATTVTAAAACTTNVFGSCWRNEATSGTATNANRIWSVYGGTSASFIHSGAHSLMLPDKGSSSALHTTMLVFPAMNFTNSTGYVVSFWIYRNGTGTTTPEGFKVYASPTDTIGPNAVLLGHYSRHRTMAYPVTESTNGWYQYETDPITLTGTVYLIFEGQSYFSSSTYIDDVAIYEAPTCIKITGLANVESLTTPNSVTLSWRDLINTSASYNVYQFTATDTTLVQGGITDTFYTVTGLTANTQYTFSVVTNCGAGDTSLFSTAVTCRTACDLLTTLPYTQDFESESTTTSTSATFIPCWGHLNNGTTYFGVPYVGNSSTYNHTSGGSKGLYWNNTTTTGTYGDYQCIVFPGVDADVFQVSNLMVRFWAKGSATTTNAELQVGVMTNPSDINSFVRVATINVAGSEWVRYQALLSNYTGEGQYVAIKANRASWTVYADDFELMEIPACFEVTNLTAQATANSAVLSWTPSLSDPESGAVVEYKVDSVDTWTEAGTATGSSYVLSGLDMGTNYIARVASSCSDGEQGDWIEVEFTTRKLRCIQPDLTQHDSITIGNGTISSYYVPIGNYYKYSYTQELISADEMDYSPTTITGIDFEYGYATPMNNTKTNVTIYLANTSATSLTSAFVPYDSTAFVKVWHDTMNCSQGWNHFEFDTPFNYDGNGSLLIAVMDSSFAYPGSAYVFKAHAATGMARYIQKDSGDPYDIANPGTGTSYANRVNMRLHTAGCSAWGNCASPAVAAAEISSTSVTVAIAPGASENSWEMYKRAAGETAFTLDGIASTNSYTFSDLLPGTEYEFQVWNICEGDTLIASLSVYTQCAAVESIVEDFNSYNTGSAAEFNHCWYKHSTSTTNYPYVNTVDGEKAMYFYSYWSSSAAGNYSWLATPQFSGEMNTLSLEFDMRRGSTTANYGATVLIGTMTDPTDINTFDTIAEVSAEVAGEWEAKFVSLADYEGQGTYIALLAPKMTMEGQTAVYNTFYIDNLHIGTITCPRFTQCYVRNVEDTQAEVVWDANTVYGNVTVTWSTVNNFVTATNSMVVTEGNSYVITGLAPDSVYYCWVSAECGDATNLPRMITFQTESSCGRVEDLAISNLRNNSVTLTWNSNEIGTPATNYSVKVFTADSVYVNTTTTNTYYYVENLSPEYNYTVNVFSLCGDADSSAVASLTFTTPDSNCAVIGNGTSTTSSLPVYGYYKYSYTNMVWTADELASMGDTIRGVTFSSSYTDATPRNRTVTVYMGQTDYDDPGGFVPFEDLTEVFSGTMSIASGTSHIDFDTFFVRDPSKNLVLAFDDNTNSGGTYTYFHYATTSPVYMCYYTYSNDTNVVPATSVAAYRSYARPNIVFDASCVECVAPTVLCGESTPNSIELVWNGSATSYSVEYRGETDTVWTVAAAAATGTSYTVTGLEPASHYYFRVGNSCTGAAPRYGHIDGYTGCVIFAVPYSENFNDIPGDDYVINPCWIKGNSLGTTATPYTINIIGNGPMVLMPKGSYIVLPEFDHALNTLQLRLTYLAAANYIYALVGVCEDPNDILSAVIIDTLRAEENAVGIMRTVKFDNYTGENGRIVIWSRMNQAYFDNLNVELIPMCGTATDLTASNVTVSSVDISWTAATNASRYLVDYYKAGDTLVTTIDTNVTSITLNGLDHSTTYKVDVRTVCATLNDTSIATNPVTFTTECAPVTLPYVENFENCNAPALTQTGILPNCWNYDLLATGTYAGASYLPMLYGDNSYAHSGHYSLRLYGRAVVTLPEMPVDVDTLMISFHDYCSSYSSYKLEIGVCDSNWGDFAASFVPIDTVVATSAHTDYSTYLLSRYTGTGRFLAFRNYYSTYQYSTHYIDDIVVDYLPSCLPVINVHSDSTTTNGVWLAWNEYRPGTAWEIAYSTTELTDPSTGTIVNATSNPFLVSNLSDTTTYYFYVRTDCGNGDYSIWSNVVAARPNTWNMRPGMTDTVYMCGGAIYDDGGVDGDYTNSQSASIVVIMPSTPASLVSVSGRSRTEGSYDYLRIYDGAGTTGEILWQDNTSGVSTWQTFENIVSNSGPLTLYFHSDGSTAYEGFECNVSCIVDNCPVSDIAVDTLQPMTSSSVTLTWTGSSTAYQIEYGPSGFVHDSGIVVTSTTNSYTFTDLSASTMYDFYVRGLCNVSDTGLWHGISYKTPMCDNFNVATIGSETSTTTAYTMPVNNLWKYTLSEIIVDSAELGGPRDVEFISFYYNYTTPMTDKTNVDIYIQPTTKSSFDGTAPTSATATSTATTDVVFIDSVNAVLVYSGPLNCTEQGWNYFGFSTPYQYNGQGNLMVIVDDNSYDYNGSSYIFKTVADTTFKALACYSDSQNPDATDSSTFAAYTGSKYRYKYRPVMQLGGCGSACFAPESLIVTDTAEDAATITWTGSADSYEVACVLGTWFEPATPVTVSGNTHTFTGMLPDTVYTIGVRSVCSEESVSQWVFTTVRTLEHICMVPTNIQVSNVTLNSAVIDWTPGEEETEWELNITGTNYDRTVAVTSENKPYTVTGLANNQTYFVKVRAICAENRYSDWSDTTNFTTATCQPVSNLGKSNITAHSATISWNAPSASVENFEIEYGLRGFNQGSGTLVTVNGAVSYNLTGLLAETAYDVYVRSVCAEGANSTWSAISVTTLAEQEGIEDVDNASISLYPNPASSTVTLTGIAGMATVTVVDMNGRVSGEWTVNDGTLTIDVTSMAQGAYFVRIVGEQTNAIRKLIVR